MTFVSLEGKSRRLKRNNIDMWNELISYIAKAEIKLIFSAWGTCSIPFVMNLLQLYHGFLINFGQNVEQLVINVYMLFSDCKNKNKICKRMAKKETDGKLPPLSKKLTFNFTQSLSFLESSIYCNLYFRQMTFLMQSLKVTLKARKTSL